jgi:aminomethyltransferase
VTNRSPLHGTHEDLGARFTDFGGWEMPLHYEGTLAEHRAVRDSVGVFDVSHLGRFELSGTGALDLVSLSRLLCNDPSRIEPGRAQYTMMLTAAGGVIDDIIVWWLEDERFIVLPNGANHDTVMGEFADQADADTSVTDLRSETALLAVQGPAAPSVLEAIIGTVPKRFRVLEGLGPDGSVIAAGTGYTGERGAELLVAADTASDLTRALLDAGAVPCGLGARDTLRLEMGFPLWGHDLDRNTTPLEAGLGWVVGWDHPFVGRDALIAQRDDLAKRLVGFRFDGRTIPRQGHAIRCGDAFGTVTSGNFSPTLGAGIGLGYLSPPPGVDAETVEVEIRGEWHTAAIVDPPFIDR